MDEPLVVLPDPPKGVIAPMPELGVARFVGLPSKEREAATLMVEAAWRQLEQAENLQSLLEHEMYWTLCWIGGRGPWRSGRGEESWKGSAVEENAEEISLTLFSNVRVPKGPMGPRIRLGLRYIRAQFPALTAKLKDEVFSQSCLQWATGSKTSENTALGTVLGACFPNEIAWRLKNQKPTKNVDELKARDSDAARRYGQAVERTFRRSRSGK